MPVAPEAHEEIQIPEGVTAELNHKSRKLTVTGPKGTLVREFAHSRVSIALDEKENKIIVHCTLPRRQERALVGTWRAHINNMLKGVTEGFEYRMKIVYSHFPIKTRVKGKTFYIENFLGEKEVRTAQIVGDTEVKISGDQVILTGINIEDVGQSVANIEQSTRIKNYDPRVFQDGIYKVSRK
jgi:large subunit ribosomal protein L6